jgi:hypothetical protein
VSALAAMFRTIGVGDLRLDLAPGSFERLARFLKAAGGSTGADALMRRRIDRDDPPPLISVNRHASAHAD